ncbi:MAG TPA: S-ribosylhomocysteine lyase [Clostridia bacterium]|nr:S-ribosylhomocysteine lyase [Clostridia bacterium]
MLKIASFAVNHNILNEGFYLSREDGDIFTYDMRFKKPNNGDYLSASAMHTIEHLLATALRNGSKKENVIYFGPMGCRTGFYVLFRTVELAEAKTLVKYAIETALTMNTIPGNKKIECGNFRSHNLNLAKTELSKYLLYLS